jgi:hypothetical protein
MPKTGSGPCFRLRDAERGAHRIPIIAEHQDDCPQGAQGKSEEYQRGEGL